VKRSNIGCIAAAVSGNECGRISRTGLRAVYSRSPSIWPDTEIFVMIRKLKDGRYRLYSRKKDPKTGKRRNLGTFTTRAAAMKHERAVQFFKRGG
jgi:hypothetical protein